MILIVQTEDNEKIKFYVPWKFYKELKVEDPVDVMCS